jgi:hypothetical protein
MPVLEATWATVYPPGLRLQQRHICRLLTQTRVERHEQGGPISDEHRAETACEQS